MKKYTSYSVAFFLSVLVVAVASAHAKSPPTLEDISKKTLEIFQHRSTDVQAIYKKCTDSMKDRLTAAGKWSSHNESLAPIICAERLGREYFFYPEYFKTMWDANNSDPNEKPIEYSKFKNIEFSTPAWDKLLEVMKMFSEYNDTQADYSNNCFTSDLVNFIPKDIQDQQFIDHLIYNSQVTLFRCLVEMETLLK